MDRGTSHRIRRRRKYVGLQSILNNTLRNKQHWLFKFQRYFERYGSFFSFSNYFQRDFPLEM